MRWWKPVDDDDDESGCYWRGRPLSQYPTWRSDDCSRSLDPADHQKPRGDDGVWLAGAVKSGQVCFSYDGCWWVLGVGALVKQMWKVVWQLMFGTAGLN